MISIILTIHNQEEIIQRVLDSIYSNASELVSHVIILLDGCTDNSAEIVNKYNKSIHTDTYTLNNVFETRANNFGLRLVNTLYAIIIQDDCLIQEEEFDKRLIKPMELWNDIFAVSGRNAHNICTTDNQDFPLNYPDCTGWRTQHTDRNKFYVRQVVNRGPLALRMSSVKELGYLDERIYRQNGDDHLLCLDAYKKLNMKCGNYCIDFTSEDGWGSTRRPQASGWINDAISRNQKLILELHSDIINNRWNEERCI